MADEPTPGELARSVARIEDEQRTLTRAIADSNRAMVPVDLHKALQTALTEHIRVAGIDHDRLERNLADLGRRHDRDVKSLRDDLDKEIAQARAENREQIAALKRERETSGMNAWQRFGIASASVLGLLAIAVAFYVGVHK